MINYLVINMKKINIGVLASALLAGSLVTLPVKADHNCPDIVKQFEILANKLENPIGLEYPYGYPGETPPESYSKCLIDGIENYAKQGDDRRFTLEKYTNSSNIVIYSVVEKKE